MPRPPRRARACMCASERTARSHERPRSTLLSEDRFDPPHATAPGHDAVGVAQKEADPREPSARPATSDRPAAQNSVAAAPRLITNAPNESPQRDLDTADGGSRRVGARFEPTRRRQAARWPRGRDGSGPGARPCSAARASRPRRAKASWRERGACGHAAVWRIFTRFYRACCKKLSRHRCIARPRRDRGSSSSNEPDRTAPAPKKSGIFEF